MLGIARAGKRSGRKPREDENADDEWRAYSDGVRELIVFCRQCAGREFAASLCLSQASPPTQAPSSRPRIYPSNGGCPQVTRAGATELCARVVERGESAMESFGMLLWDLLTTGLPEFRPECAERGAYLASAEP